MASSKDITAEMVPENSVTVLMNYNGRLYTHGVMLGESEEGNFRALKQLYYEACQSFTKLSKATFKGWFDGRDKDRMVAITKKDLTS